MAPSSKSIEFFQTPRIFWFIIIPFGILLLALSVYCPDDIPGVFGPLTTLSKYLGKNHHATMEIVWILCVLAHFLEAAVAVVKCRKSNLTMGSTMKWWLQTFLLGFPSLRIILHFQADQHKKLR